MTINVDPRVRPPSIFRLDWISPLDRFIRFFTVNSSGPPRMGIQQTIMRVRTLLIATIGATIVDFSVNLISPDAYDFLKRKISSALWRIILLLALMICGVYGTSVIEAREKRKRKKRKRRNKNSSQCNGIAPNERSASISRPEDGEGLRPEGPVDTLHDEADTEASHLENPVGTVHEEANTESIRPNSIVPTGRGESDTEGLHPVSAVYGDRTAALEVADTESSLPNRTVTSVTTGREESDAEGLTTAATARGGRTEGLHQEGPVITVHEEADTEASHRNVTVITGQGESDTEGLPPVNPVHSDGTPATALREDTEGLHPEGPVTAGRGRSDTEPVGLVHRALTAATAGGDGLPPEGPLGTVHEEVDTEALHLIGPVNTGRGECGTEDSYSAEIIVAIQPGNDREDLRSEIARTIESGEGTESSHLEGVVATVPSNDDPESSHRGDLRSQLANTVQEMLGNLTIEQRRLEFLHPSPETSPLGWFFGGILRFLQRTETLPSVDQVTVDFSAITIHTNDLVPEVEAASESDLTLDGSKVVYKWLEIGPQDRLSLQIIESMSKAQEIDKDSTFQLGSFAVLKHTDKGPKWWRLPEHSTPRISNVGRYPWSLLDLLLGRPTKWFIQGINLQDIQLLKVSTVHKKEDLTILRHLKMENREDLLLCEEPQLVQNLALWFKKDVYIYATKKLEVEKGVKVDVQSKPYDHVQRAYWISVVQGSIPSLWATILMGRLSLANITNVGFNLEGTMFSSLAFGKLCSFIVYLLSYFILVFLLTLWRLRHGRLQPAGSDVPGLERTPTLREDLTSSPSPTSLPSVDHLSENITRDPSPTIAPPLMPSQEEEKSNSEPKDIRRNQKSDQDKYGKRKGSIDLSGQAGIDSRKMNEQVAQEIHEVQAKLNYAAASILLAGALLAISVYQTFCAIIAYVDLIAYCPIVCSLPIELPFSLNGAAVFLGIALSLSLSLPLPRLERLQRVRMTLYVGVTFLCTSMIVLLQAVAANYTAVHDKRTLHGGLVVATRVVRKFVLLMFSAFVAGSILSYIVRLMVLKPVKVRTK